MKFVELMSSVSKSETVMTSTIKTTELHLHVPNIEPGYSLTVYDDNDEEEEGGGGKRSRWGETEGEEGGRKRKRRRRRKERRRKEEG